MLTKVFSDDLKIGKVVPVYKSGDKDDLNNYLPISVLPTVARVLKRSYLDRYMNTLPQMSYWVISSLVLEHCIQLP